MLPFDPAAWDALDVDDDQRLALLRLELMAVGFGEAVSGLSAGALEYGMRTWLAEGDRRRSPSARLLVVAAIGLWDEAR